LHDRPTRSESGRRGDLPAIERAVEFAIGRFATYFYHRQLDY